MPALINSSLQRMITPLPPPIARRGRHPPYPHFALVPPCQIEECEDAGARSELQAKLEKVSKQLYSEKRTVFRGWLKNLFVGQAVIACIMGGVSSRWSMVKELDTAPFLLGVVLRDP